MMIRRTRDRIGDIKTLVGPTVAIHGHLVGQENVLVLGTVEGRCELSATLLVAEQAHWKGDVRAENLIVAGVVEGDLYVSRKLELESTARITGNVSAAAIAIAEGAIIDGKLETTEDSAVTSFSERRSSWITALIRQFFEPRSRDASTEHVLQSPEDRRASRKE